jgi:sodium-dependent dicarboxylate transporter 2/3/5
MDDPTLSPGEQRFERLRQRAGFFIAPVAFLSLLLMPISGLDVNAHRLLAVVGLTVTLWITEAVPLAMAALIGPALCVVLGIGSAREVFRGFADPVIFLFLGSFLLAEAMIAHGLNRRIALRILGLDFIAKSPARLVWAFALITAAISMWVSNTATAAMMFPIALSVVREQNSLDQGMPSALTTQLMLATAFAATLGGFGTPVGTPPNLIGLARIETTLNIEISFFQWMVFGVPLALALAAAVVLLIRPVSGHHSAVSVAPLRGPLTRGEVNVLIAFGLTVLLWLLPGVIAIWRGSSDPIHRWLNERLPESMVALLGAVLLFLLPVDWKQRRFTLTWKEAMRIDWGTILLFGGGLALGDLMFSTGLARWIGEGVVALSGVHTTLGMVVVFTVAALVLSETTSNTASAAMIVPAAIAVAQAAGVPPLQPAMAACLGASLGFMLPVSTPPNAIFYGSGLIPLRTMMRYGILLDLIGVVLVVAAVYWIVPLVLKP